MKAVVGLLTHEEVPDALTALKAAGVATEEIAMLASAEIQHLSGIINEHADEKTVEGALAGSAVGGTLAALGAIALVPIPGVGPFLASGLMASAIGGVAGGYYGALLGSRSAEQEEIDLKDHIKANEVILVVLAAQNSEQISAVFKQQGARNISIEDVNVTELQEHGELGVDNE